MFDDLFGGLFDINGDGVTSLDEIMIAEEIFFTDDEKISDEFGVDEDYDDFDFSDMDC